MRPITIPLNGKLWLRPSIAGTGTDATSVLAGREPPITSLTGMGCFAIRNGCCRSVGLATITSITDDRFNLVVGNVRLDSLGVPDQAVVK